MTDKEWYSMGMYNGKSLLEWAKIWFKTDNDTFFRLYGFNFNPHEHPGLYEIAREEVFKNEFPSLKEAIEEQEKNEE